MTSPFEECVDVASCTLRCSISVTRDELCLKGPRMKRTVFIRMLRMRIDLSSNLNAT